MTHDYSPDDYYRDQLNTMATDLARRQSADGPRLTRREAAAGELVDLLVTALHDLPLCDHARSGRVRLGWAPGLPVLGCIIDLAAHAALNDSDMHCDLCGTLTGQLHPAFYAAGPVQIHAALCADCHVRPAAQRQNRRAVQRTVIHLVMDTFRRAWSVQAEQRDPTGEEAAS